MCWRAIRAVAPHIRTLNSFDRRAVERLGLVEGLRAALAVADIIAVEKSVLGEYWDAIVAEVPLDRLGAWVPNEEADLSDWLFRSIRQITTDRPDLAVTVREGMLMPRLTDACSCRAASPPPPSGPRWAICAPPVSTPIRSRWASPPAARRRMAWCCGPG